MSEIRLSQGTIEYADEGDPSGRPVVCVHGFLVDGDLWRTTSQAIGERARVLRPTLPLGSHRIPLGSPLTPRAVAETLLAFCDELQLEDPLLLGNDTGGAICQFALDEQPRRVRRVVLTNCDAFDQFPPGEFALLRPASRVPGLLTAAMQGARIPALRHALIYGLLAGERDDALWKQWVAPWLGDRRVRAEGLALLRAVRTEELLDVTTRLAGWGGEARLVWGLRDRWFTAALGRRLAAVLRADFVEIAGAKTFVPLDAPQRLADEVVAFLGAPPRTAAPAPTVR